MTKTGKSSTIALAELEEALRKENGRLWNHNQEQINMMDVWLNWNNYPNDFSYPLAGLFIQTLIETYGKEKFLTFFPDQTYEHAVKVFGSEIDKFITDFENRVNAM